MSIIRVKRTRHPSQVSQLNWDTRGVLSYLLGKPDGWEVRFSDLLKQGPAGRETMRRIIKEMQLFGYAKRERLQGNGGKIEWETTVYDTPIPESERSIDGVKIRAAQCIESAVNSRGTYIYDFASYLDGETIGASATGGSAIDGSDPTIINRLNESNSLSSKEDKPADSDSKPGEPTIEQGEPKPRKQSDMNRITAEMEGLFVNVFGNIPKPTTESAANKLWYLPLREMYLWFQRERDGKTKFIYEEGAIELVHRLFTSLKHQRDAQSEPFTIASPKSILMPCSGLLGDLVKRNKLVVINGSYRAVDMGAVEHDGGRVA